MPLKLLFICAKNRLRSTTAEQLFADWRGVETASAGVNHDADTPVCPELLALADLILVMQWGHRRKLTGKFKAQLGNKRIVCLDIADDYTFMDPALIYLLSARVLLYLPARQPAT